VKFELSQRQDPYAVFVAAMAQFVDALADNDQRLPLIQKAIQEAVGHEGGLLTQLFPSLTQIINEQEKTAAVAGNEAKRRFQFLFCQLLCAISEIAPLVLLIDDIQWSDPASLDILRAMLEPSSVNSNQRCSLLFIFTLRDNDENMQILDKTCEITTVSTAGSSSQCLCSSFVHSIRATTTDLTEIRLSNFSESKLNDVISGMFSLPTESAQSLTSVVYQRSNGNIFHSVQLLRQLQQNQVLVYSAQTKAWTFDDNEASAELIKREGVLEALYCQKLERLQFMTREMLKVAACMADVIDEASLSIVMKYDPCDLAQSIEDAAREDLLIFVPQTQRYRFAHDQIRQAALSLIEDTDDFSLQLGRKLMRRASPSFLDAIIFTVVNLLNRGIRILVNQEERYQAARLNLDAGLKAVSSAAFPDACRYFEAGIAFLKDSDCWKENYQLSLNLYDGASDAELCCQNFDNVAALVSEVYKHARSETDKFRSHVARINAIGQRGNVREAMRVGVNVLKSLGEPMVSNPCTLTLLLNITKTKFAVKKHTSDALLACPSINDELKLCVIHLLTVLLPYAIQSGSTLSVLIGTRLVQLNLRFGMCKDCSYGFATFSWILCKTDRKEGYRLGRIALSMVETLGARELIPRIHIFVYYFTCHWIRPLRESLAPLQNACRVGLEVGDVEYAMYAAMFHAFHSFYSGMALPLVQKIVNDASNQMRLYQQDSTLEFCNQLTKFIRKLTTGIDGEPTSSGVVGDTAEDELQSGNKSVILVRRSLQTILSFLFRDLSAAEHFSHARQDLKNADFVFYSASFDVLLKGIIAVGQARQGICRRRNMNVGRRCLRKMRAWATDCPHNFLNKQKLLEAELSSLSHGKSLTRETNELYGDAYRLAAKQGFKLEAALACELAGDYMQKCSKRVLAHEYWEQAYNCYVEWGAKTKADQLRARIQSAI
jgi:predicted ATPase